MLARTKIFLSCQLTNADERYTLKGWIADHDGGFSTGNIKLEFRKDTGTDRSEGYAAGGGRP